MFTSLDPAEGPLWTGRLRGWFVEEIGVWSSAGLVYTINGAMEASVMLAPQLATTTRTTTTATTTTTTTTTATTTASATTTTTKATTTTKKQHQPQ